MVGAFEEFNVNLGTVYYSSTIAGAEVKVIKTKKSTVIMKKKRKEGWLTKKWPSFKSS